ncbi:MAG: amidohydrolase family protein [Candidatus Bathyarchaeia archaeon]
MTKLFIKDAFLIDGTGATPMKDAGVVVEGERIAEVGRGLGVPKDAEVIEAEGRTVMPGLMDLHVHLASESLGRPIRLLEWTNTTPPALKLLHAANNAKKCLEAGFTTVRNMGTDEKFIWDPSLREAIDLGVVPGPRVLASACVMRRSGTFPYGNYVGMPEPQEPVVRSADGPYEFRRAVREAVALGADFIKFFSTGNVGGAGVKHTWVMLTMEEIEAITDEAHRMERRVACHAHGTQGIQDAVVGGTDTIEHGTYLDDECVELMKERGVYYVPTLSIVHNLITKGEQLKAPPHVLEKARETWENHVPSVKKAHAKGVKIACGTDGAGVWAKCGENGLELEMLVRFGGLTPMEAIVAATKTSAEAIGRQDQLGTLETGKLADLIIVDGNPLKDIKVLQDLSKIEMVMEGGRVEVNRGL